MAAGFVNSSVEVDSRRSRVSAGKLRSWMAGGSGVRRISVVFSVLCVVLLGVLSGQALGATIAADVSALKALSREWGPHLNWVGDPCDNLWLGVVCDSTNTTVTSLNLDGENLAGRLPPEIGGLANLEILELSANKDLTGSLPKELGNLRKLKTLSLQWCRFTGQLPSDIGNLVDLEFLGVNGNNLTGRIPDVIGNLNKLTWMDISQNEFSGSMPVSTTSASGVGLDTMTAVEHFHFNNNSLSGSIPPEIFSLPNLIHLIVDHNELTGEIPAAVGNSKNMAIIRMDFNQLEGPVPVELGNLTTLADLNLRHNKLTGVLPDLSGLTNLQSMDVSENNFDSHEFPSWVLGYTQLQTLVMGQSNIAGELPGDVFELPSIETLDLRNNQINGSLTFTVGISKTLSVIILDNNQIDGFDGVSKLRSVNNNTIVISLFRNPVCENEYIKPVEGSCDEYNPNTAYQRLQGTCNMDCDKRKIMSPKLCLCAYPLELKLWLTAPSFSDLNNQTRLSELERDLAEKLSQVEEYSVTLKPNQVWIRNSRGSPDSRIQLDVLVFPETGNSLSSEERNNIVRSLRQHKITLNEGPYNLPDDSFSDDTGTVTLNRRDVALIAVGGFLLFVVLVGVAIYAVRQRRVSRKARDPFAAWGEGDKSNRHGAAPQLKTARPFSLSELKGATNNWNEVVGEGGYGKVYKGTLNGAEVAIKRANKDSMQGLAEFKNELELLSRVHHRNLVDLVGFCYESGEQLLVYEFMSNGTLRERLYERVDQPLSWQMRLDIILNAARGLSYLHDHASPPIIHGDIKSANILLNHKMLAKVADFGLSKPTADDGEKIHYSDEIRGTRGYLDPEYFQTHIHTDKSDVFSFGVLMVETLTAKSPTHGGKDRTREVRTAIETGGLAAMRPLMDPFVQGIPDTDLEIYMSIALRCTEDYGEGRPTMTEVVKELEGIAGGGSLMMSGAHKIDMLGNKSPEVYSDTALLVKTSTSTENEKQKESEGNSFQYSGAYGVTTTIQPK